MSAGDLVDLIESRPDEVLMVRTGEFGPMRVLNDAKVGPSGDVELDFGQCVIGLENAGGGSETIEGQAQVTVLRGALVVRQ